MRFQMPKHCRLNPICRSLHLARAWRGTLPNCVGRAWSNRMRRSVALMGQRHWTALAAFAGSDDGFRPGTPHYLVAGDVQEARGSKIATSDRSTILSYSCLLLLPYFSLFV